MGEPIAGLIQKQIGGNTLGAEKQVLQQSQNNTQQKFENVLQQNNGQTNKIDDARLENMRVDLMQRYQQLPEGVPKATAIFPEYMDVKTRMSEFKDVLNKAVGSVGSMPQGTNIQGRFSQVEDEWLRIDGVMRSNKELSQGELLGLQARLYQVSQHIEVLSKVVDQMTGGVKTILNTNV
jgi:hypothetical protein